MNEHHRVLVLDSGGYPKSWISKRDAIIHHAKDQVSWELGEEDQTVFTGGVNRISGNLSTLSTLPIISIKNDTSGAKRMGRIPALDNQTLFRRDAWRCAYCGKHFKEYQLTRDHIHPVSRGGPDVWMNVITACKRCNNIKDDYMLDEIGWDILYEPYVPNHVESLFYKNLNILPCQTRYLETFIKEESRVWDFLSECRHETTWSTQYAENEITEAA